MQNVNKTKLREKIELLEKQDRLQSKEAKTLELLKGDLQYAENNNLGFDQQEESTLQLGSKSIFYDPDWNPKGEAPAGHKNVPYAPHTFKRKGDTAPPQMAGLTNVKPPLHGEKD